MRMHLPSFGQLIVLILAWVFITVATLLWVFVPVITVPPDRVDLDRQLAMGLVLLPPTLAAITWYVARRSSAA